MAKSSITINIEYWTLRSICAIVNLSPYSLAMGIARLFGKFAFYVIRFKRTRTIQRIRSVFPEKSDEEVELIALRSLENIFMTAVEMMRAPSLDRDWMDKHVVNGRYYKDLLQQLVDEGSGVVIMVPHSGNWYMPAWAMAKYGLRLFAIAARQRNPKLNRWMNRQYGDIEVLDRDDKSTLGSIKARLKEGKAFAILPDLRVRKRDVEVDFFGGKANVSHAGARFAVYNNSPIVVAMMRRDKNMHIIDYLSTLRPNSEAKDKHAEAIRLTREVMKCLDDHIHRHPCDWYWYNKRWILEPPTE